MGFLKFKSFKFKSLKLKILVYIAFFLFLLGIVWYFFGSYKKEGFLSGRIYAIDTNKNQAYVTTKNEYGGNDEWVVELDDLHDTSDKDNYKVGSSVSFDPEMPQTGWYTENVKLLSEEEVKAQAQPAQAQVRAPPALAKAPAQVRTTALAKLKALPTKIKLEKKKNKNI